MFEELKNYSNSYDFPEELYVKHRFVTYFEQDFQFQRWHEFVRHHFHSYIYLALIGYLLVIFSIKKYMDDRKPFELRTPLILWNFSLAAFSTLGAVRTVPELFAVYQNEGFVGTLCHRGHSFDVTGLWLLLFVLSKIPEFGDTLFIVLRKRPLIFLHWYHHVETAYYSIWSYTSPLFPVSRYFVALNFFVHSVMYTYYGLRACGCRLPKPFAMIVTTLQVSQMFVGLFVIISAIRTDCYNHPPALLAGLMTYLIYAALFCNLFYNSYMRPSTNKSIVLRQKTKITKIN